MERNYDPRLPLDEDLLQPMHDIARTRQADDRIAQRDDERIVTNEVPRAPDRMPQSARPILSRVIEVDVPRLEFKLRELIFLTALPQRADQFRIFIKMVLDTALALAGNEENLLHVAASQFLDNILNDRLLTDRQHLLRLALGRRQQPRPQPRHRNNRLLNIHPTTPSIAKSRTVSIACQQRFCN